MGPGVLGCVGDGAEAGEVAWAGGEVAETAFHVVAEELGWIVVELICFVAVDCLFGSGAVDRWLAGKRPCVDRGVY